MGDDNYLDRILTKAHEPGITRERKRMLVWKAMHLLKGETTSVRWVLTMNIKMWVHEKLFGTKWCE